MFDFAAGQVRSSIAQHVSPNPADSLRTDPIAVLRREVLAAAAKVAGTDQAPNGVAFERPKNAKHGDFATNAAMVCAPIARDNPRNVATKVGEALGESLGASLSGVDVAGPGFLNLTLSDDWYAVALTQILDTDRFGGGVVSPERINVEFPSANPTGPMHIGHGRNAAFGDALCRVLEFAGNEVVREYYSNDFGTQVERFGQSVAARARGDEVPEDGYQGEYVAEIAASIDGAAELPAEELQQIAVDQMLQRIGATLQQMRVRIDVWFSERSLHADGRFESAIEKLRAAGHLYESDGALWLRTTSFGETDDKDRVLRRSNGDYTYFATDIAYHDDKYERGDRLIDVWGADHHGYIGRMKVAIEALGRDPQTFEPLIMQLVNLIEDGQTAQLSKRLGRIVTVEDLIDYIGVDAMRFFLLQRSIDTAMDLDLGLAREQSDKNPVYYVQYAHARINSILEKAGIGESTDVPAKPHELVPAERALIRRIGEFPDEVAEAAARRGPHRLTIYARDLAAEFSAFYRDCKVVGEDAQVTQFRVALCVATKRTLAQTLDLLGVSAPERM